MTCTNNCKDCIHGIPQAKVKCGNPGCTCDGMCHRCVHKIEVSVRYLCGKGEVWEKN